MYYVVMSYLYTWRYVANMWKKYEFYSLLFLPITTPLFVAFCLVWFVAIIGFLGSYLCMMWVCWAGLCVYSKTPLIRNENQAVDRNTRQQMKEHETCDVCYSDSTVEFKEINHCPECMTDWCHMCNT
jgi:hypothetical protein